MAFCDCPICPLVQANTQVCNVLVRVRNNQYPNTTTNIRSDLSKHIITLVLHHKNNLHLKINESHTVEMDGYHYTVERPTRTLFKVCFHTN
jgi:hypothetical protein